MIKRYLVITKTLIASFFRDWQDLFFTVALPLVFLLIFGSLYSGMDENRITNVAVYINGAETSEELWLVLDSTPAISSYQVNSLEELQDDVKMFRAGLGLTWDGDSLGVYTNPVRIQDNAYFEQLAQVIKASLDKNRTGIVELVRTKRNHIMGGSLFNLDFMFPGIIALGVLSSGLFAISSSFMHYKDKKILKRLAATSVRKTEFVAGLLTTRLLTSIISTALVLACGVFVYEINFQINWALFIPYVVVATICMMGLGCLVTLIAKTAENAVQISTIMLTIMVFFSGVYFPIDFLPEHLQRIGAILPLSYVSKSFRYTMGVELMEHSRFLIENTLLFITSLILIVFVTVKRRWTEKG
ncbi:MAG: ABC transporter permease [Firmicutes bacterium]|nr:ABC transporter permease [Bacillota bacterium]